MARSTELFEEAKTWLQSARARGLALQRLKLKGLPLLPEDLCADVLFKIWNMLENNPDREIDNVPGYCAMTMNNVIYDMLRARKPYDLYGLDPEGVERSDPSDKKPKRKTIVDPGRNPTSASGEPSAVDRGLSSRVRACIEAVGALPIPTSAVLTYVILQAVTENEIDLTGLPQPKRGARKDDHARWWPSLHLAHQDPTLFPWMNRQNPAQRQRLTRARRAAELVLRQAKFLVQNEAVL